MPGDVLIRSHGFPVDHVALAVRDTRAGLAAIAALTGVEPHLAAPEPGAWYWSAGLTIGKDSFLEIIGPNPDHRRSHPLKMIVSSFASPSPLFWYVATDDFDAFHQRVRQVGARLDRIERVGDDAGPAHSAYTRGVIGPGFLSQRPNVIQWRRRAERPYNPGCLLTGFSLRHPGAAKLNELFGRLEIPIQVDKGKPEMAVRLSTPRGDVTFAGSGMSGDALSMLRAAWTSLTSR
jgi:hypothetical protein